MHEMKETTSQGREESITNDDFIGPTASNMLRKCRIASEETQHKLSKIIGELKDSLGEQGQENSEISLKLLDLQKDIQQTTEDLSAKIIDAQADTMKSLKTAIDKKIITTAIENKKGQKQPTISQAKNPNGFHAKTNSQQNASKEQAQEETEDATASAAPTP